MKFQLESNRVEALSIERAEKDDQLKNKFHFKYHCLHDKNRSKEFVIVFDFDLQSKKGFRLSLEHHFLFKASQVLSDEFLGSHFTTVNAPAIAYPYLRAFVSTILLNGGLESILLPAVNFVELSKKQSKDDKILIDSE
ncbi:protein-export chaperone SecB [Serratia fonticola]|uniref:protein-export chaperone SecB n=1 Tax=Serratia fonticola TaxID=47917 RepID=UPI000BA1FBF8|nr:protein-export chaperone SecB [Serratia fonticola]PAA95495.1 hypothetical protein CJJ13_21935 [Serratia fonticola]